MSSSYGILPEAGRRREELPGPVRPLAFNSADPSPVSSSRARREEGVARSTREAAIDPEEHPLGGGDYHFLKSLAEEGKEDLSKAVRDLVGRGRVLLALEHYRKGKASLSKAAEVAGLSIGEMMDVLGDHGIASDLRVEDYRESLHALREIW